jgi:hypothetical protein
MNQVCTLVAGKPDDVGREGDHVNSEP